MTYILFGYLEVALHVGKGRFRKSGLLTPITVLKDDKRNKQGFSACATLTDTFQ